MKYRSASVVGLRTTLLPLLERDLLDVDVEDDEPGGASRAVQVPNGSFALGKNGCAFLRKADSSGIGSVTICVGTGVSVVEARTLVTTSACEMGSSVLVLRVRYCFDTIERVRDLGKVSVFSAPRR